ncbi:MAG TPA: DUF4202 domain-containing protein [Gammaproteobacteria bacterium]|nr:DUF4202 domain-containing protein [Gammaproteobacteria bacterium]
MSEQTIFDKAIELFDSANREDPNKVTVDGKEWPKELLYSHRMSEMLQRFKPEADDEMKLAIHAQHIQRWKSPRTDYPMNRQGYLQWRVHLYQFHADTAGELMQQAGYSEESIARTKKAVSKKGIKVNADSQLLEDIADLVFLEYYMEDFVARHPEYDEEKWLEIIRKTWRKMSGAAQEFALAGNITLPEHLVPLIQKAVA